MKLEWKTCLRLGVTAFLLYLATYYWEKIAGFAGMLLTASGALLLGCVIAYILNILMSFYERYYFPSTKSGRVKKSRRPVCMVAAVATLVGLVVLIVRLVIPELIASVRLLVAEVPDSIEQTIAWLNHNEFFSELMTDDFRKSLEAVDWEQKITQMFRIFMQGVGGTVQMAVSVVSTVAGGVTKLAIGTVFAMYLLLGKERLISQFKRLMKHYLPSSWDKRIMYVTTTFNGCFHRFIVGQCTEAVILGGLCIVGMWIFRFPYAVMVGTLVGFTALIPVAGAYIGAGVGAFMILTVSPVKAVGFLIFIAVLQQLEGNLIYPKVVGTSIGLPGVWVLTAVTIGGGLMGIPGMLLGVPAVAALYQLVKADLKKIEEKEALPLDN